MFDDDDGGGNDDNYRNLYVAGKNERSKKKK